MTLRFLGVVALVLAVLLAGTLLVLEIRQSSRIAPGVQVWDVDVGGSRIEEAAVTLENDFALDERLVTLRGPDQSWRVPLTALGVRLDASATLARAYQLGRDDSWTSAPLAHVQLLASGADVPPVVVYDQSVARLYLETLAQEINFPPTEASLSFDGLTPVVDSAQTGQRLDIEGTLAVLSSTITRLAPSTVDLVVDELQPDITDAETARAEAEALLDGPLTLVLARPREGDPGPWVLPPEELVRMIEVQEKDGVLHAALAEEALRAYLEGLAPRLVVEPVNARFHFNEWTEQLEPISDSQDGRRLDVEASIAKIAAAVAAGERYVSLAMKPIPPSYPDTATAEELGITTLVSQGESYFIGSPSGRDHNIRLAATKFDGIIIPPGETFSFNHYLGAVTAEAGYDESYITAGEQLQMGIGGGICQVSTTAFRAAFWGGYPITERWYHGQRVGYYELRGGGVGMDATVYSPHVDFKFVNDREAPLLIETDVEEGAHRLIFRFYSTDDGRRVEQEDPEVSDKKEPGPPIYQLDDEMAPGTVIKWQSAVDGLTATVVRRVYDASGALLYDDTFVSEYAPRRAAYHYGPGYEPPQEEEQPTPADQ